MYRIIVSDRRTEVRDERGDMIFATANRVFWQPPARIVAIGDPDEWLSNPGPMGPEVVEARLVEQTIDGSPSLGDLWEAFLVYCETAARMRSKSKGLWPWLRHHLSVSTVVLRFSDPRVRFVVADAVLAAGARRWNLVNE